MSTVDVSVKSHKGNDRGHKQETTGPTKGPRRLADLMRPLATSTEKRGEGKEEQMSQMSSDKHTSSFPIPRMGVWKRAVKMSRAMNSLIKTEEGFDRPKSFANSFRMLPPLLERFSACRARAVLEEVLRTNLQDTPYEREACQRLAVQLAESGRGALKTQGWQRYKLVLYVVLGQSTGQGLHHTSRCVWNSELDDYACATYSNEHGLYAVATVYAAYFD